MPLNAEDWFAMSDIPAGRCKVRVVWNARMFVAARVLLTNGSLAWATVDSAGKTVALPPKAEAKEWGMHPERWQPECPVKWTWPNGEAKAPLVVAVHPQMWNAKASFDAAEAAEAVAEMEADRAHANAIADSGREFAPKQGRVKRQLWWLDQSKIKYTNPPTRIEDVEGRLMRAMAADGDDRDPILAALEMQRALGLQDKGATLDDLKRLSEAELRNPQESTERFRPNGTDSGDDLTALGWLCGVSRKNLTALWLASRMQGLSYGEMADALSIKGAGRWKGSHALYRAGIAEAFDVAIGVGTDTSRDRKRRLQTVKRANLEARHDR